MLFVIAEIAPEVVSSTLDNDKENLTYIIRGAVNGKMSPPPPLPSGFKDLGSIVEKPPRSATAAAYGIANDEDHNGGDAREQADDGDGSGATVTEVNLYPQGVRPEKRVDWQGKSSQFLTV